MILHGEELRKFQLTLLELIREVDRVCRKNGIEYSLDGGTLLGAVRHGGASRGMTTRISCSSDRSTGSSSRRARRI